MCIAKVSAGSVSALVADTKSGLILAASNADDPKHPASLTKVMTLYLTFWALDHDLVSLEDRLPISEKAARQPKSKLYLKAGDTMSVYEAMMALIIKSANDAAVVLAESLAGSEEEFAEIMTETATKLGLKKTVFKNASGLHHPEQVTTAKDMAVLTIALINHYPDYYALFSTPFFEYKGKKYYSHNEVLKNYDGAEGLKTGFITAAGYNIISTAKRDDSRLVTVVIGEDSTRARDKGAMEMLDEGFYRAANCGEFFYFKETDVSPLDRQAFIPAPVLDERFETIKTQLEASGKLALAYQKNQVPISVMNEVPQTNEIAQGDASWGIQVGAYHKENLARLKAEEALGVIRSGDKKIVTPRYKEFFRSRIFGFKNSREAMRACQTLKQNNCDCFAVGPVSGE
jgi:D-alanyl-D-alanine carboxypeptidase